jgi:2-polyprenyl-3-methyl-5-hydroxy-6-metoxy-1,4-benzoquinol methylase
METVDFRNEIYESYGAFKGWDSSELSEAYHDMYRGEFQQHSIPPQGRLLEIGFGSGHFLSWAKSVGFKVVGVEVNSQFVDSAKAKGLEVYQLPLQQISQLNSSHSQFDVVVLLDVLEHLYPDEIIRLFKELRSVLAPGGAVVCRFPNGLSPFSTQTQWADLTHVTVLTPERMRQIGVVTGFEVKRFYNSYRSLLVGKRPKWQKIVLYKLRDVFETVLGLFYFGGRVPLDPNLSISLVKK